MHEARCAVLRGDAEHLEDLPMRGRGGIVDTEANTERALLQAFLDLPLHFFDLGVRSCFVSGVTAWKKDARIVHHRYSRGNVADACAVVDQRLTFSLCVPLICAAGSDFKLE